MSNLYPHQVKGAAWLQQQPKLLLADEPGLGKTRTALASLDPRDCPLVLCPAIARGHWQTEAAVMGRAVFVMSYDELVRKQTKVLHADTLILDEAHHLRNFTSQRTKLVLARGGLARKAERVIALTGTPYVKHAGDAACLSLALWPDRIRAAGITNLAAWRERFLLTVRREVRGHWVDQVVGQQREAELNEMLAPVMLRRTLASTGLQLPSIWWQTARLCSTTDFRSDMLVESEEIIDAMEAGTSPPETDASVVRLRHELGIWKAPVCAEYLQSQYEQTPQPLVVFYHHRAVGDLLFEQLRSIAPLGRIDGATSDGQRNATIRRFQDGQIGILLAQTQSCKEAITLTAARKCYFVEPDWTGMVNLQAAKRLARIGQAAGTVVAQFLSISGTLDDAIVRHQRREVERVSKLVGA